jgi:hypothetical protein
VTTKNDTQHNKTRAKMHYDIYTGCSILFVIMLSAAMLSVIVLIVMAPFKEDKNVIKTSHGSMLAFRQSLAIGLH